MTDVVLQVTGLTRRFGGGRFPWLLRHGFFPQRRAADDKKTDQEHRQMAAFHDLLRCNDGPAVRGSAGDDSAC